MLFALFLRRFLLPFFLMAELVFVYRNAELIAEVVREFEFLACDRLVAIGLSLVVLPQIAEEEKALAELDVLV